MRAYRLVKARYADTALNGSGAKAHGGRWNSKGVTMVYASDSVALAALELLVHLHRSQVLNQYVLFSLELPDESVMVLDDSALPPDWRDDPSPSSTAAIGDKWIANGLSLALAVPSTLVSQQRNVLFNPAHAEFRTVIAAVSVEPFNFDPRLSEIARLASGLRVGGKCTTLNSLYSRATRVPDASSCKVPCSLPDRRHHDSYDRGSHRGESASRLHRLPSSGAIT